MQLEIGHTAAAEPTADAPTSSGMPPPRCWRFAAASDSASGTSPCGTCRTTLTGPYYSTIGKQWHCRRGLDQRRHAPQLHLLGPLDGLRPCCTHAVVWGEKGLPICCDPLPAIVQIIQPKTLHTPSAQRSHACHSTTLAPSAAALAASAGELTIRPTRLASPCSSLLATPMGRPAITTNRSQQQSMSAIPAVRNICVDHVRPGPAHHGTTHRVLVVYTRQESSDAAVRARPIMSPGV